MWTWTTSRRFKNSSVANLHHEGLILFCGIALERTGSACVRVEVIREAQPLHL
jgi:hypothetical protein